MRIDTSVAAGNSPGLAGADANYLYVVNGSNFQKISKADLSVVVSVAEGGSLGAATNIIIDGGSGYTVGTNDGIDVNRLTRFDTTTLAVTGTWDMAFGSRLRLPKIFEDVASIYIVVESIITGADTCYQINKTTMLSTGSIGLGTGTLIDYTYSGGYLYALATPGIYQIDVTTMTLTANVWHTPDSAFGGLITAQGSYVYMTTEYSIGGHPQFHVYSIDPTTMTTVNDLSSASPITYEFILGPADIFFRLTTGNTVTIIKYSLDLSTLEGSWGSPAVVVSRAGFTAYYNGDLYVSFDNVYPNYSLYKVDAATLSSSSLNSLNFPLADTFQSTSTNFLYFCNGSTQYKIDLTHNTLTYIAGPNGTIVGSAIQIVADGVNGTPVTATPNAGYFFAQWSDGSLVATRTDVSANLTYTATFLGLPVVTTGAASGISATGATLNGQLNDDGGVPCNEWFEWGLTNAYGNTTPIQSLGIGDISAAIAGLSPGTLYHFRIDAQNGYAVTVYGADATFNTIALPSVSTLPASALNSQATLNGPLTDDGGEACDCGFQWGLTPAYGNTTPTTPQTTGESFSQLITALTPGTLYHFRAFATNSAGTSYGGDLTFTPSISSGAIPSKLLAAGLI